MDCQEFLDRYSDYDDSLLGMSELERFRAHLAGCQSCTRYDRVLRKGRMLARQLPPPEPGRDFVPRLQHQLWQERHARRRRSAPPVLGGAAAALAAVTVTLSALWSLALLDDGAIAGGEAPVPVAQTVTSVVPTLHPVERRPWSELDATAAGGGGWAGQRVDPRVATSYSPLVTGPPAYRPGSAVFVSSNAITRPALD